MAKVEILRALMNERLTAVLEEICGFFETTVAEYEEKVSHSNEIIKQQHQVLNDLLSNAGDLHSADTKQGVVIKKEQQELRSSLDQDSHESLHIKDEQEELWSSRGGQHREGSENSPLSVVPGEGKSQQHHSSPYICVLKVFAADTQQVACTDGVPSVQQAGRLTLKPKVPGTEDGGRKDDEGKAHQRETEENREAESPASSSAQQMEMDGEGLKGAEPALQPDSETSNSSDYETEDSDDEWKRLPRQQSHLKLIKDTKVPGDSKPTSDLQPSVEYKTSSSSETEDSDDDWKSSRKPRSSLPSVKPKEVPKSSLKSSHQMDKTSFSCSICGKRFQFEQQLKKHTNIHSLTCSERSKRLSPKANFREHTRSHCADKLLNSSVSNHSKALKRLETKHAEEECFPCSICDKKFKKKGHLGLHMKIHKVEHMRTQTGGNR